MTVDWVRKLCLSLPHTTETVQWGANLVFKVAGKMYVVLGLEPDDVWIAFKSSSGQFAEWTERPNIRPAPYLARAQWVALETPDAMTAGELEEAIRAAYLMVFAKLPRKVRLTLEP
jgi:predicted DNA-binding protein (MmcQ/YjbR family)